MCPPHPVPPRTLCSISRILTACLCTLPSPPLQCDITAVGATSCRHGVVAHLLDISTGERYIYACVMLYALLVMCAIPLLVVWYDINCKFRGYFMRWAAGFPALLAALSQVPEGFPSFPLPCFHRYSHRQVSIARTYCGCVPA